MGNFFPEGMPLPGADMETKPFWDYCKAHELRCQRCSRCGTFRFPPAPLCYKCHSFEHEWVKSRGVGEVYSRIIVHHPPHPVLRDVVPYNVVVVQMDDCGGMRVTSNIVDCPNEEIRIGMPVEVVWEDTTPEVTQYRFKRRQE